jgi:hypothetical protein
MTTSLTADDIRAIEEAVKYISVDTLKEQCEAIAKNYKGKNK